MEVCVCVCTRDIRVFPEWGDLQDRDMATRLCRGTSVRGGEAAVLSSHLPRGAVVQDRSCAKGSRGKGRGRAGEGGAGEGGEGGTGHGRGREGMMWMFLGLGAQEPPDDWGDTRVPHWPLRADELCEDMRRVCQVSGASFQARQVGPGPVCVQTDTHAHAHTPVHVHTGLTAAHTWALRRSTSHVIRMPGLAPCGPADQSPVSRG